MTPALHIEPMTFPASSFPSQQDAATQVPYIVRARLAHCLADPFQQPDQETIQYFQDGAMLITPEGVIEALGDFAAVSKSHPQLAVVDRSGCLILPGFVDCHTHYPQTLATAAYGEQLLDWLDKYIFPEEARYLDDQYAERCAQTYFEETISQGTTCALIFGAHFESATDLAFQEAERRGFRAIMGMSLADRNMPEPLLQDSSAAISASSRLIEKWHGRGKARYAVTPRFAPSCSELMLQGCSRLMQEHPEVYLHTHANENREEIEWCRSLFPKIDSYLGVYEHFGLLNSRTVVAHCIHCTDAEIRLLSKHGAAAVHCPSSNAFLGSGILPLSKFIEGKVKVGLGTDVGAGATYSILNELNQAYKLQMLLGVSQGAIKLTGAQLLFLATMAGAQVLGLQSQIGNLQPGKSADFVVLDPAGDAYFEQRLAYCDSVEEMLFVTAMLADKTIIREVYMSGRLSCQRDTT